MNQEKARELINKYLQGELNSEQWRLLNSWYLDNLTKNEDELSQDQMEQTVELLRSRLALQPLAKTRKLKIWYIIPTAAAAIALIVSSFYFFKYNGHRASGTKHSIVQSKDIPSGQHAATLTLTNGEKIELTDSMSGELAKEAGVSIIRNEKGELVYVVNEGIKQTNISNVLSTTAGQFYMLILPDRSKVWLNASSSLKYPANFTALKKGEPRRVELSGEAYFEISKDEQHPFIVETENQEVKVLGTHFNINAYADEKMVKTTLLEGSVKISNNAESAILKAGQQASQIGGEITIKPVDIEQVVGWKNGDFVFNGEDIQSVMRQVARWYNVDVFYHGEIRSSGVLCNIPRTKSLLQILKALEMNQGIHFKIEGRRVTVMP